MVQCVLDRCVLIMAITRALPAMMLSLGHFLTLGMLADAVGKGVRITAPLRVEGGRRGEGGEGGQRM